MIIFRMSWTSGAGVEEVEEEEEEEEEEDHGVLGLRWVGR